MAAADTERVRLTLGATLESVAQSDQVHAWMSTSIRAVPALSTPETVTYVLAEDEHVLLIDTWCDAPTGAEISEVPAFQALDQVLLSTVPSDLDTFSITMHRSQP
jgi:hypothetical protein